MKAVILTAGSGRRLGDATRGKPKCLVEIDERSILEHQINALEACGFERYLIVVGFRAGDVIKEAQRIVGDRVEFVYNPIFAESNTSYSLWLAMNEWQDDFYLLNGDVLFPSEVIFRLQDSTFSSALALQVKSCGDEEVKVIVEGYRAVRLSKDIMPELAVGEFIGVARLDAALVRETYRYLDLIVNKMMDRMAYFEKGIEMALDKHLVGIVDITDLPATEIDFPEDLRMAREIICPEIKRIEKRRIVELNQRVEVNT